MEQRLELRLAVFAVFALVVALSRSPSAQWPRFPTPGAPRTVDGRIDPSATAPRTADGRPDLSGVWENQLPTWFGHSIGWWEGDTLVIDTIGYTDKFWFDSRGTPHTEQLHTIERWTRINFGTLVNELTMIDPGTFSRPVTLKFTATHIRPDLDLMEFICLEDNQYGKAGAFTPANEKK